MLRAFPSLLLALSLPLAAACGGDDDSDDGDDGSTADAGDDGGDDGEPDAGSEPDASGVCVPTDALPAEYRPIAKVSAGKVTVTPGEVTEAVIDATAGNATAENPYVYIDLEKGAKVEIDDVAALDSGDWDIAFKRSSIRINGGDSGTGEVAAAIVQGTLEEVTEAPAEEEFVADDWVSDECEYLTPPKSAGEPASAIGLWYDYDFKTHTLSPKPEVYVVRTRSGEFTKLAIVSFYADEADPDTAANYTVTWAPL
jgi:HmuY protein